MDGSDGLFEWALGLPIQRPLDQEDETENSPRANGPTWMLLIGKALAMWVEISGTGYLLACGYMTCGISCGRVSLPFPFSLFASTLVELWVVAPK